jgi:hypothetical protein
MADVIKAARDAGATAVWTNVLYLKPGTREHFVEKLARDWPELLPSYERLYEGRAYVAKEVLEPVKQQVRDLAKEYGIADRRRRAPAARGEREVATDDRDDPRPLGSPAAEQLSLASALR